MPVEQVSDTALLTAYARAMECERDDALFRDLYALRLAGPRGAALARESEVFKQIANSVACRTTVFDELLIQLVRTEGIDLVVNLAAGLDTRPWRLPFSKKLAWLDVDLPDVLAYKRVRLRKAHPRCTYETCAARLNEPNGLRAVLERVERPRKALVLSEGLLVYLSADEVGDLARQLHCEGSITWWITDLAGPRALAMIASSWGRLLPGVELRFAPSDPVGFFSDRGWDEVEFRSSQSEARRLGRSPKRGVMGRAFLALAPSQLQQDIRRLSGVSVLRRR
jgi:methyltransferase (TIGR00027 family)